MVRVTRADLSARETDFLLIESRLSKAMMMLVKRYV